MGGHGGPSGYKKGGKKLSASTVTEIKTQLNDVNFAHKSGTISDTEYGTLKSTLASAYGIDIKTLNEIEDGTYGSKDRPKRRRDPDNLGGNKQPASGQGVPSYYNTATQNSHPLGFSEADIASRLGVSAEKAQELRNAINGGIEGGFTRGWDSVIRAYQRGATKEEILNMSGTKSSISSNFGGDQKAFFARLAQKANACEELIDRSPKWKGKMLYRGFRHLSPETLKQLTDTSPDAIINLNAGTASWTTRSSVAKNFANSYGFSGSLVAHVSGTQKRRATSIMNGSHYKSEYEVLASKREAFRCTKVEVVGGITHAYYEVVDTDYDWS